MPLNRSDIAAGLRALGLKAGDTVLVHSALSAIGDVEGGPDAVIDAFLETLGPAGTLLMPTLTGGVFDLRESPSTVGLLTEAFRRRPGTLRSVHPTHSVVGVGRRAAELLQDHLLAPTPCGKGTPYGRLAEGEGFILLLGCDHDRNTTLHTVEDYAKAPYLSPLDREYVDPADGRRRAKHLERVAGPHRNFIGLDPLFRRAGIQRMGKVGGAVCRLLPARAMVETALDAMRQNPALMLCDNPECRDCVLQKGKIKAARLAGEEFRLAVSSSLLGVETAAIPDALAEEGIQVVELDRIGGRHLPALTPAERRSLRDALGKAAIRVGAVRDSAAAHPLSAWLAAAEEVGAEVVVYPLEAAIGGSAETLRLLGGKAAAAIHLENGKQTAAQCLEALDPLPAGRVDLAFNPAGFARARENPFLHAYYHTRVKRRIGQLRITDGAWGGAPALPGMGNGEVKELISILRCKSFPGLFTLSGGPGAGLPAFREAARAFWRMLDEM